MKTQMKHIISDDQQIAIFDELKDILQEYVVADVALVAGVGEATIYFWLDGTTRKPRLDTIVKVAAALGYELRLHKRGATGTRKRRHLSIIK